MANPRFLPFVLAVALVVPAGPDSAGAAQRVPSPAQGLESEAAGLVLHRALYKMTLESANSGSGILGAEGAMLYRFAETCTAWTVETNIYLRLRYPETGPVDIAWSYASLEAKDGLGFRFRMTHKRNGRLTEALKGFANLDAAGGPGRARFEGAGKEGKDTTVELPKGTLFPTRHLLALVRAGAKGTRFFAATVFDGASLDNPYRVSATVGAPRGVARGADGRSPDRDKNEIRALFKAAGLGPSTAWPVRLAFFPFRSREPMPEFELGLDYRADGVAERITQDYGDFAIGMVPGEIEVLDRPEC